MMSQRPMGLECTKHDLCGSGLHPAGDMVPTHTIEQPGVMQACSMER